MMAMAKLDILEYTNIFSGDGHASKCISIYIFLVV